MTVAPSAARVAVTTDLAFRDLAIVVVVAGATTLLFYRLKQPVVLGYLLAGFLVGPHSPGPHVESESTLRFLGELGIVFLLFALGLEFNLKKIRKVGLTALAAAVVEITVMLALGYAIGRALGWGQLESLFLGSIISISSTTIIVKVLDEKGGKTEGWAQLAFGILLIEDIIAIVLLTVLSSAGASAGFDPAQLGLLFAKLGIFLGVVVVLGLLVIPRFTDYLSRLAVEEVVVVAGIGTGFAVALLGVVLGFSPGLGAFIGGALMAESPRVERIEHKVTPFRDLFSGVFFVTVGAAIVPAALLTNWHFILIIAAAVIAGKVVGVSVGAFIAGRHPVESLRVGLTLAQIGEFSFVIAVLGVTVGAARPEIYAIAVGVSALTAFTTPYLVANSRRIAERLHGSTPVALRTFTAGYVSWVNRVEKTEKTDPERRVFRQAAARTVLYAAVTLGLIVVGAVTADRVHASMSSTVAWLPDGGVSLGWVLTTFIVAPFVYLWTVHLRRAVRSLARLAVPERLRGAEETTTERLLRRAFSVVAVVGSGALVLAVGMPLVGSPVLLVVVLGAVVAVTVVFGRSLRGFHKEIEATLDRLTGDQADAAEAVQLIETGHAWGAGSRTLLLDDSCAAVGRTIADLRIRELTGATIVNVRRAYETHAPPAPRLELLAGDNVMLVGDEPTLLRAEEILRGIDLGVSGGVTNVVVRPGSPLVGEDPAAPETRRRMRADLLRVRRDGANVRINAVGALQPGDTLVAIGPEADVAHLEALARPPDDRAPPPAGEPSF